MDFNSALEKISTGPLVLTLNRGIIKLAGSDAQAFLNKMTTNDMSGLSQGPLETSFLDARGRLQDHVTVFKEGDDLVLVSSYQTASRLGSWIETHHFFEDFEINDLSGATYVEVLVNPSTKTSAMHLMGHLTLAGSTLPLYMMQTDHKPLSPEPSWWDSLRIAARLPSAPHEINDTFMPQNVGLMHAISTTKGCYPGQEVIAKALHYQKQKKSLCGLHLPKATLSLANVGDKVFSKSQNLLFTITSKSPDYVPELINVLAVGDSNKQISVSDLPAQCLFSDAFIC